MNNNTTKGNSDSPFYRKNKQLIIGKIKADITKILGDYYLQENTTDKEFEQKIRDHVLTYLPSVYDDFDINLFDLALVPVPGKKQTLSIQPQNFITALWMHGVDFICEEVKDKDFYTNEIASFEWDEEEKLMNIRPHSTNMP